MIDNIKQSYRTTTQSLLANKGRSFLTILGIIIGVSAVIIIIAVGAGAQSLILSQVENLGSNLIGVIPGKTDSGQPATLMGIVVTTLTYDDLKAIKEKRNAPHVVDVVGYTKGVGTVSWKSHSYDTNLSGATRGYLAVEGGEVEEGRFFSNDEERNLSRVVVLGSTVKEELFGQSNAVGQKIKVKKQTLEVIGVMKERGTVAFQDYDDQVFIPINTMQKLIVGVNHLGLMRIKVDSKENLEKTVEDVKMTLREQHDIRDISGDSDDFTVVNSTQIFDTLSTITNALKYFLAAMAALSLVVGGIGIMNIMLISVRERTKEIGLRKAVGANNKNVLIQFLLEAIFITLIGGMIGIILGTAISYFISVVAQALGYSWKFLVPISGILLAAFVSSVIGVLFGIYPALKASKLEPIEALSYE